MRSKYLVDEEGRIWDVTDEDHPVQIDNSVTNWVFDFNLTEDDKAFMRSLRIKT